MLSVDVKEKHYARFEGSSNLQLMRSQALTRNLSKSQERKI